MSKGDNLLLAFGFISSTTKVTLVKIISKYKI